MGSPPIAGRRALGMRKCWEGPRLLAGLCAAPAVAADLPTTKPPPEPVMVPALPSTWHFEATLLGYAANLSANVGVRNLPTSSAYANVFQILKHLEGILPVSVVAYNDNFIVGANLFWLRVGVDSNFGPANGAFTGANANVKFNETFATGYGGVRIPTPAPDWLVWGILGARVFNVNATVNLDVPVTGFARSTSQGKTWADPIVGVTARHRIDDKWSLLFETDAGGYSRSATAQIYGAVAYKWNQYLTTRVGGRVIYAYYQTAAERGNGTFRLQETIWGPLVDTVLTF